MQPSRTASILNSSVYCTLLPFDICDLLAQSLVAQQGRRFSGARSGSWLTRNGKSECRALAGHAVHADRATVQFDDPLGKRQAETRAFGISRLVRADLLEFLEKRLLILGGDPDSGVGD